MEPEPRRIVLCLPGSAAAADPAPAESAKRDVELVRSLDGRSAGVVGFAEGGWDALDLAAEHPELVDRLVLVSTPPREGAASGGTAKTLLLYGQQDPGGGYAHGTWCRGELGARLEMVPDGGHDILERAWARALSHLAPGTLRKQPSGRPRS